MLQMMELYTSYFSPHVMSICPDVHLPLSSPILTNYISGGDSLNPILDYSRTLEDAIPAGV